MTKYSMVPLNQLSLRITKGTTPTTLGYAFKEVGINFVKSESIQDGGSIDVSKFSYIDENTHRALQRSILEEGDVLFSMAGVYLGKTAVVPHSILPANTNQAVGIIRLDRTKADPYFVHYSLSRPDCRMFVHRSGSQSAQPNYNLREIGELLIPSLSLSEQRQIVDVLRGLDDKIEQNRRTSQALENLARATFKAWFVDFEPVKAKAAGATSFPGMPPDTFAALPTRLTDSPLGPVPEGWEVKPLGDLVTVRGGGTPSTKNEMFWSGGTHCWATPKDLSALQHPALLSTARRITDAGVAKITSGILPIDTVLLSSRAPVGYLALAKVPTAINQGFIAITCNGPLKPHFLLHWLHANMEEIKGRASGTTFAEISKTAFRPIPAIVPSSHIIAAFEELAKPMFDLITHAMAESSKLAALRDYLLPRLLSGQVRVSRVLDSDE